MQAYINVQKKEEKLSADLSQCCKYEIEKSNPTPIAWGYYHCKIYYKIYISSAPSR